MRAQLIAPGALVLALVAVTATSGCSADVVCGKGTHDASGVCVLDAATPPTPKTCEPACAAGQHCADGTCVKDSAPGTWRCAQERYGDGEFCDCECGAPDPDCANAALPVPNCRSGTCGADGKCADCLPRCDGKECGADGCGGVCGVCSTPGRLACLDGQCGACVPDCEGRQCGPDGCGGSCGSCASGQQCTLGACSYAPSGASCLGRCGGMTESGCACTESCARLGTCCADVAVCGCLPQCEGRECGDDGCGGTCGGCASGQFCHDGTCAADPCASNPCSGHGTCHSGDGSCSCAPGFDGVHCDACVPGFVGYPACAAP